MSYLSGGEYGYDQIHVGVEDIQAYAGPFDVNRPDGVTALKNRETRLFKKIKNYAPSCERKREMAHEDPDFFTRDGMYETHRRQQIRDNIERYRFGDKELRDKADCKCKCNKESMSSSNSSNNSSNDSSNEQLNDIRHEIMEIEKKNNMLVLFVFFLAVVVLVQYSKLHNDPSAMRVLMMPGNSIGQSAEQPTKAAAPKLP
jgi:hypothetical protein